jgi:hypothetical protein
MDECFGRKVRQAFTENLKSVSSVAASPLLEHYSCTPYFLSRYMHSFLFSSLFKDHVLTIHFLYRQVINNTRS